MSVKLCNRFLVLTVLLLASLGSIRAQVPMLTVSDTCCFVPQPHSDRQYLYFNYAGSNIKGINQTWAGREVEEVRMVFSLYPADTTQWKVGYEALLQKRIQALREAIPALRHPSVRWSVLRLNGAVRKSEAQRLFHGAEIRLKPLKTTSTAPELSEAVQPDLPEPKPWLSAVEQESYRAGLDTFSTRPAWHEPLVGNFFGQLPSLAKTSIVLDWTASMYPYGIDALTALFGRNQHEMPLHFVLFNDGDGKQTHEKKSGSTGGIYFFEALSMESLWKGIHRVRSKGSGGDNPENDVEALLAAQASTAAPKEIYLVADNRSAMRDSALSRQLHIPVHSILCNTHFSFMGKEVQLINKQYAFLALRSGGSIVAEGLGQIPVQELTNGKWPVLRVEQQDFWVLNPDFNYIALPEAKLMFVENTIQLSASSQKAVQQKQSKWIEMNQANFPEIFKINEAARKQKPRKKN